MAGDARRLVRSAKPGTRRQSCRDLRTAPRGARCRRILNTRSHAVGSATIASSSPGRIAPVALACGIRRLRERLGCKPIRCRAQIRSSPRSAYILRALAHGYAVLWFSTPFFVISLFVSLGAVLIYRVEPSVRFRPLPPCPPLEETSLPFLVLGESHVPTAPAGAAEPKWLTIPPRASTQA
jgi:hypothetical protein